METHEPWQLAALLVAGVAAGFINVVAGGGSLLTMPLLIFLGLPESTANGTARVAILIQNASAVVAYRRAGRLDWGLFRPMLAPVLLGACVGAMVASRLPDTGFRIVLGWVMLACAAIVALDPSKLYARGQRPEPRLSAGRLWPTLFVIGLYGGMIQAGVGYLILGGLTLVLGLRLLEANILKVVLVFVYTPLAIAAFLFEGRLDFGLGLVLAAGQAVGGYLGAHAALARGEGFIRLILLLVVIASGLKLLLD